MLSAAEQSKSFYQGKSVGTLYEPRPATYLYDPPNNQVTALQVIESDHVAVDPYSDFLLMGWFLSAAGPGSGDQPIEFEIQIANNSGYNLFSYPVNSGLFTQTEPNNSFSVVVPFLPALAIPAGGRLQIVTLEELSDQSYPLQIAFVGELLFYIQAR